jgi:hypothetical protein
LLHIYIESSGFHSLLFGTKTAGFGYRNSSSIVALKERFFCVRESDCSENGESSIGDYAEA